MKFLLNQDPPKYLLPKIEPQNVVFHNIQKRKLTTFQADNREHPEALTTRDRTDGPHTTAQLVQAPLTRCKEPVQAGCTTT